MKMGEFNGASKDIHDNVVFIKSKVSSLETSIDRLANSVDTLSTSVNNHYIGMEKIIDQVSRQNEDNLRTFKEIIEHVKNAIPLKFMIIICLILAVAFKGEALLTPIISLLTKWF